MTVGHGVHPVPRHVTLLPCQPMQETSHGWPIREPRNAMIVLGSAPKSALAARAGALREHAGLERLVRGRVQDLDAIAAHRLGLVERLVGELKGATRAALGARIDDGHTEADRDDLAEPRIAVLQPHRANGLTHLRSELLGGDAVDVVQQYRELFAAVAGEQIVRPGHEHLENLRHAPKRAIAGLVTVAVVVSLE